VSSEIEKLAEQFRHHEGDKAKEATEPKPEKPKEQPVKKEEAPKPVEDKPKAQPVVKHEDLSPEDVDDFFVHVDELSKVHMGLSDKAFVDEVFYRYAQMPSKQAATS